MDARAASGTLLWLADADALDHAQLAHLAGWLGEDERARLDRFVRPARHRQFIAGRALLRLQLARVLGVAVADIRLRERPGNAPLLIVPGPGADTLSLPVVPSFSISHSGRWAACAVSAVARVGLDIECVDPERDVLALAGQVFSVAEAAALSALPAGQRVAAFYRLWCGHEARIKLGEPGAAEYRFPHPALSIALLAAAPLPAPPRLELVDPFRLS